MHPEKVFVFIPHRLTSSSHEKPAVQALFYTVNKGEEKLYGNECSNKTIP